MDISLKQETKLCIYFKDLKGGDLFVCGPTFNRIYMKTRPRQDTNCVLLTDGYPGLCLEDHKVYKVKLSQHTLVEYCNKEE